MNLRDTNAAAVNAGHELLVAKIVAMVVLLLTTIICGGLPYLLNYCFKWTVQTRKSRSARFLNFILQISGGVLFATTFLHLLPEAYEVVEHLDACNELPDLPFALPETLMCFGFFLIYFVESIVDYYMTKRAKKLKLENLTINSEETTSNTITVNSEVDITRTEANIQHQENNDNINKPTSLRGLLIVVALSLHEVFEGMAIGLENHTAAVWLMFAAVSAHKLILAFCLGVEIMVDKTPRLIASLYVLLFSIITPIGVVIGMLLSNNGVVSTTSLTAAILQGIACGTLLYVVFFEILRDHRTKFSSLLAIFIGFAIMFGLQTFDYDGDAKDFC